MCAQLLTIGYELGPSKYSPPVGYSGLKTLISGKPTQRLYDVKLLRVPTFDGRYFHKTAVSRHELAPTETFQVCLGQLEMETFRGEHIRAFSFGGTLHTKIDHEDLYCELASNAPIFKLQDDPKILGTVLVDEIMELLAEQEVKLPRHEDELYARLAAYEPYALFLASLVSLQKRADSVPTGQRREKYQKAVANLKRLVQVVHDGDGWDGRSLSLEELLAKGGA